MNTRTKFDQIEVRPTKVVVTDILYINAATVTEFVGIIIDLVSQVCAVPKAVDRRS